MKATTYDAKAIETKWQSVWERAKLNQQDLARAKNPFYNLMMFPYPSAEGLHVGNMYAFTGSDIYGRFKRMQGYDVFEPIGLDGFGIHSENYALKIGRHPMDHASVTEKNYYAQLQKIGAMFDWSRTVETYNPNYYRFTQWLFVQIFKHGLAYRAKADVNWCPSCKTVLADEQVLTGSCERCGNKVEKRALEQWFFRITAYAEKLLQNLFTLNWSSKVRVAQQNWIGKKEGITIAYPVFDSQGACIGEISCFTTRPDTNFGATFVVLSPEHPFVSRILKVTENGKRAEIERYVAEASHKSEEERIAEGRKKTGVATGLFCLNRLTKDKMPLYISDFVLMSVGTGAVVGVPGHDTRDFEFAMQFDIPVKRVVAGTNGDSSEITTHEQVHEGEGTIINSGFLNGLDTHTAIKKIMDALEQKGWGRRVTTYHLRDWLISRQRYWGPPIPMIFCENCAREKKSWFTSKEAIAMASLSHGSMVTNETMNQCNNEMSGWYPVPEDQLPVLLPRIEDYRPGDDGVAPLAKHKEFYHTTCPECGGEARRETDVSDTFLDSAWYFLRYPSVGIHEETSTVIPWDPQITRKWLPVDMYTGGAEHSVLHLMYSRFVCMALHDWGYIDFDEPFTQFFAHGLVIKDGAKMSKSKGNVVNPDEYIALYGADALRLYLMFMGPFSEGGDFRDTAMEGMSRWVKRVWRLAMGSLENQGKPSDPRGERRKTTVKQALHRLIKKVTDDIKKRRYNTAIASMMEFTNFADDEGGVLALEDLQTFTLLLAPFAPHVAEEVWYQIYLRADAGNWKLDKDARSLKIENQDSAIELQDPTSSLKRPTSEGFFSVHTQPWPQYDEKMLKEESVVIVIQINGKLRDQLLIDSSQSSDQKTIEQQARKKGNVARHLAKKQVKNVVFVPGKLINFVTE